MLHNMENKSVRWEFIKSLEPPRVVQVNCLSVIEIVATNGWENQYSNFHPPGPHPVRVRQNQPLCAGHCALQHAAGNGIFQCNHFHIFHLGNSVVFQTLAVFDRFGRLIHGGRDSARDVLEYVVFERHLANIYGRWRMHAKIVPEWAKDRTGGWKGSSLSLT